MPVTIPPVGLDPAALRAAAAAMTHSAAVAAAQADTVARTWLGLGPYYTAPEAPQLLAALDPVRLGAAAHQRRIAGARTALDAFLDIAEPIVRQLDELRVQAATAPPADEPRIRQQAQDLLGALQAAEQACAGAIRSALDQDESAPTANPYAITVGTESLRFGDQVAGDGLIDSGFEESLLRHFTAGTGSPYVLSPAELSALAADPAVRQAREAVRSGRIGRDVLLEGGVRGREVEVDFKLPVPGRVGENPYDGSLGKTKLYFDENGHFVGMADLYDFTNDSPAVDAVNLVGGVVGAQPYHVRAGIVAQRPPEEFLPVVPDAGEALDRLVSRDRGIPPGPPALTPRPR